MKSYANTTVLVLASLAALASVSAGYPEQKTHCEEQPGKRWDAETNTCVACRECCPEGWTFDWYREECIDSITGAPALNEVLF